MNHHYLLELEYLKKIPMKSGDFKSHDNYEIFYFHEGKGNYLIGDKIHPLYPGTLILMDGMTLHSPNCFEGIPYIRTTINFDPGHIKAITNQHFTINPLEPFERLGTLVIQLDADERQEFEDLLAKINHFVTSKDVIAYSRYKITFIDLLFYIYNLLAKSKEKLDEFCVAKDPHVKRILQYIEENYMNDVQLDQLGKDLYANKYYLARTFREVTGMTIFTFLYRRRINQAKIYFLVDREKSITDICYMVGFKNRSHFGKVFRKLEGITPEQFRESIKRSNSTLENFIPGI
jgi:AraC-like DNA-binding protein